MSVRRFIPKGREGSYQKLKKSLTSLSLVWWEMPVTCTVVDILNLLSGGARTYLRCCVMRGWTAVIEFRVSGTTPLLCRGDEELGRFHMPSDVCAEHSHRWSRHFLRGGSPFLLEFSARPCG